MPLLNPPQILPHAIRPIVAWLADDAGAWHTFDEVAAGLAPAALGPSPVASADSRPANLVHTLNTTVSLGLAQREGSKYRLDPNVPGEVSDWTDDQFRDDLRRRVLASERNEDLWEGDAGSNDLTRGLAWFLAQTPYRGHVWSADGADTPFRVVQSTQRRQATPGSGATIFANNTRWEAFQRWSVYLGFAVRSAGSVNSQSPTTVLVADPTGALRQTVLGVLPQDRPLSARSFLADLAIALPVLDLGRYRLQVEERMAGIVNTEEGAISAPLALALLRLDAEKVIRIERRADPGRDVVRLTTLGPGIGPLCARIGIPEESAQ